MNSFGFKLAAPPPRSAPAPIKALAAQRWEAKQTRDWATADSLRAELTHAGWQVADQADSYQLSPLSS